MIASVKCEIDKHRGIDELWEDITDIASDSETGDSCSHTREYDDVEEVWDTKGDDTRDRYTSCHAKYCIIRCFISDEELARWELCRKKWKEC